MQFDRRLQYQLGLLFVPNDLGAPVRELVTALPEVFAREPEGSHLRIRFRDPVYQEGMVQTEAGFVRVPMLTWSNGVWQLGYSNERLDLYANPLSLEELIGERPGLADVVKRVLGGLVEAAKLCASHGLRVGRMALISSGETAVVAGDEAKAHLRRVAALQRGDALIKEVEDGTIIDLGLRTDFGGTLDLRGESVRLHRVENVGTHLGYERNEPRTSFRAQWDFNTAPIRWETGFDPEDVAPFFEAAVGWMLDRQALLARQS